VDPSWYAIIDCAQDPRLVDLVQGCATRLCLFKGEDLDPALLGVAPWLVRLDPAEALLPTWQQHGHAASWGLMLLSARSIEDLQRHFRRYLQTKLPDGTIALFRFYDPRVFNTYVRAMNPDERTAWFTAVSQYSVEAQGGTAMHHYRLIDGGLYDGNDRIA
jgi:hypothetical protein